MLIMNSEPYRARKSQRCRKRISTTFSLEDGIIRAIPSAMELFSARGSKSDFINDLITKEFERGVDLFLSGEGRVYPHMLGWVQSFMGYMGYPMEDEDLMKLALPPIVVGSKDKGE